MNKICFYHSADLDGKCSAAIVKKFVPDVELYPYDYGEFFPWNKIIPDTIVYMVDISISVEDMYKLNNLAKEFIYIDHHISKMKDLDLPKFKGLQVDGTAACILTWQYFEVKFYPKRIPTVPRSVWFLGLYDTWHLDDNVLDFQYGMRKRDNDPNDIDYWNKFIFSDLATDNIIDDGKIIRKYFTNSAKNEILKNAFHMNWKGYNVLTLNKTAGSSLIFEDHPDYKIVDILMVFGWVGTEWKVSLYTLKDNIDCSEICKTMGGGGHRAAAGFKCKELPFKLGE